jgi:hypothetical protein
MFLGYTAKTRLVGLICCSALACSLPAEYVALPVEDARIFHGELQGHFDSTRALFEAVSEQSNRVGVLISGGDSYSLEIQFLRSAMMSCFNDIISLEPGAHARSNEGVVAIRGEHSSLQLTERSNLGDVRHCMTGEIMLLEQYLVMLSPPLRGVIVDRVMDVDSLRVNLKHVLHLRMVLMESFLEEARNQIARMDDIVRDYRRFSARRGDGLTPAQRIRGEEDYLAIEAALNATQVLLREIEETLPEMMQMRSDIVERVAEDLARMGEEMGY